MPAADDPTSKPRVVSRRRALKWGLGGAVLLGGGALVWRVRGTPRTMPPWVSAASWRFLTATEATVVAAVAARLLDPGDVADAAAPDLEAVARWFDTFLHLAHVEVQGDLRSLLAAFDGVGPLAVGVPGRFVNLALAEQTRVLRRWEHGPHPMRMGFTALKQLAYMAHYGRDATWPALGYDGPIVPRGYDGGDHGWFDPAWIAPPGDDGVGPDGRGRFRRTSGGNS